MTILSKLRLTSYILLTTAVTGCQPAVTNHSQVESFASRAQTSSLPSHPAQSGVLLQKPAHNGIPAPVRLNQLQRSNTYYHLMMSDPSHGYRSGFMANHFVMQATSDKGNTWYPIALPTSWSQQMLAPGTGQLENPHVHVLDNTSFDVLILRPKSLVVWKMTNTGKQFQIERFPLDGEFQLESSSVPSTKDAYVLLHQSVKGSDQMKLLHLTEHVSRMETMRLSPNASGLGLPSHAQAAVYFTSDKAGQVVATTPDGRLHLYQTSDSGHTWKQKLMSPPAALKGWKAVHVYQPIQLGTETTFVARYVGTQHSRSAIKTVIYHSVDGGRNYRATVADRLDQSAADYLGTPVRFINPDYGITVADGRLMLTTDSGDTWKAMHTTAIEEALHTYPRVLDIDYLAVNSIFVVLQSRDYRQTVYFRSTDSGLTFQRMREM